MVPGTGVSLPDFVSSDERQHLAGTKVDVPSPSTTPFAVLRWRGVSSKSIPLHQSTTVRRPIACPGSCEKKTGRHAPRFGIVISTGIAPLETSRRRGPAKGVVVGLGRLYGHVIAGAVRRSDARRGVSLPRHPPPGRAEAITQLPDGLHVQPLALEDNLAAGLVLPVLEVARHVHPADRLLAAPL